MLDVEHELLRSIQAGDYSDTVWAESEAKPIFRPNDAVFHAGKIKRVLAVTDNGIPVVKNSNYSHLDMAEDAKLVGRYRWFIWYHFSPYDPGAKWQIVSK